MIPREGCFSPAGCLGCNNSAKPANMLWRRARREFWGGEAADSPVGLPPRADEVGVDGAGSSLAAGFGGCGLEDAVSSWP